MAFKNMRNLFTYGGTSPDKLVKKLVDGCDAGATWDDVVGEVALNVGPLSGQHLRGMEAHKDTLVLFTREFRVHRIVMSESMVLRSVHLFVPPPPDLPSRTLSTICLDQVDLTDHTLALVVPYLAKLRNLRKLSLCTNGLTLLEPLSPLLLGEGEDFPAVLETLLLSGNAFGKHGGSDVPSFFECFRQNGALTTLDLAGNDVPLEALQTLSGILFEENDVLRTVVLKNNPQIPKEDAEAIQLQAEKNEEMLAERVRREAATGAPTPRTAEPVAVSSVTESDSSKISRLTEEVTQLRKLVAAETVQNRQLEEDIAVSTETFMAKIATITAKSEAQIDALRKYGQTQATHGSFNTPLSSQAQPPLSDSFSPYTLGTTPNLSQNSHPDDRGHSPSHSDDGFPEPAGGELGDIVEKKRKAKKPKAKRKDPNQELEEKEREAKVAALETELEEVKTASEILSAEAKAANERIQSTEEEVAGLKEDLILAASERVGVDENAALVSAELATLKASHAVLQNAHDSASEATTTAQKTVQELTAKLSAAGVLQGAAEERCTNLSRTAEQLRTEAASTALSLETMTAEKTKQTEIIASLKQTMHESATATKYNQDEVNTLREAKEKNEKEVARLSVLLATLQQTSSVQEDSGKVEVGRLVEHNTTLQNKIDELETTLRLQTTTASTSAADADARFEAKTELLTQTVSDVTTQNGILQAEASVLREQAETHRSEMQTLRSELATVNTSLSPLQAEVESLKTETVELKEQKASLETVSKDAAAATQEIAKLATELEAKTTELAEVAEKLVEVEAVCSGHGQVVERLTKEKEELEAAVAQHLEHIAALEGAGVDAEEERARLVKHVDELHEGVKKRDVELEGVKVWGKSEGCVGVGVGVWERGGVANDKFWGWGGKRGEICFAGFPIEMRFLFLKFHRDVCSFHPDGWHRTVWSVGGCLH